MYLGFVLLILSLILIILLCSSGIICLIRCSDASRNRRLRKRRAYTKARIARIKRGVNDEYTTEEEDEEPEEVEKWKEERLEGYGYYDCRRLGFCQKLGDAPKRVCARIKEAFGRFFMKKGASSGAENAHNISRGRTHAKVPSTTGRVRCKGRGFKVLDDGDHFVVDLEAARSDDRDMDADDDVESTFGVTRTGRPIVGKSENSEVESSTGREKDFFDVSNSDVIEAAATPVGADKPGRTRSRAMSVYAGLGLGLGLANLPENVPLAFSAAAKDIDPTVTTRRHRPKRGHSLSDLSSSSSSSPHVPLFKPLQRSASSIITTTISVDKSLSESGSDSGPGSGTPITTTTRTAGPTDARPKFKFGDGVMGSVAENDSDSGDERNSNLEEDVGMDIAMAGSSSLVSLFPGAAGSKFKEVL